MDMTPEPESPEPTQSKYPLFASTKRTSTKAGGKIKTSAINKHAVKKEHERQSTPVSRMEAPKGSQYSVVISDSEDESDRDTSLNAVKTRSDLAREEQNDPNTPRVAVGHHLETLSVDEDDDEDKDESSIISSKPKKSSNTARCSRGKRPMKMLPAGSHARRVSSFKPLKVKSAEKGVEVADSNGKSSSPEEVRGGSTKTAQQVRAPSLERSQSPERSDDGEEFHDLVDFRRSPSIAEVSETSKKRNVVDVDMSEGDKEEDGEKTDSFLDGKVVSTLIEESAVFQPEQSKKRKIRVPDSDREDDNRVALELESSSTDTVFVKGNDTSFLPEETAKGRPDVDRAIEFDRYNSAGAAARETDLLISSTEITYKNVPTTSSTNESEFVSREEMRNAVDQVKQEMREEMAKLKEAMRIETKRLIRTEVKDELLMARDEV